MTELEALVLIKNHVYPQQPGGWCGAGTRGGGSRAGILDYLDTTGMVRYDPLRKESPYASVQLTRKGQEHIEELLDWVDRQPFDTVLDGGDDDWKYDRNR